MTRPLAAALRRLVQTRIPSVPFLEALLLLHQRSPQRLAAADVARQLYLDDHEAVTLLDQIAAAGLCRADGDGLARSWRFDRDDPELGPLVDELARCYATQLVELTKLIHAGKVPPAP